MKHRADIIVAREIILYIAQRCTNMYNLLKVIYFADKDHLAQYGQLMYGDRYIAMSHGPVPNAAYDLVKYARGDNVWNMPVAFETGFDVVKKEKKGKKKDRKEYHIIPCRQPDENFLSESVIDCLDDAIVKYGKLPFGRLKKISHDDAYKSADENDFISLQAIIKMLPDTDKLLDYVKAY